MSPSRRRSTRRSSSFVSCVFTSSGKRRGSDDRAGPPPKKLTITPPTLSLRRSARRQAFPPPSAIALPSSSTCFAVGATECGEGKLDRLELWRGLKDVEMRSEEAFFEEGGTEAAPLSTTSSLEVALSYGAATSTTLMRLSTTSFIQRGADLSYLSAFPQEQECLYPPLTYLQPAGAPLDVKVELGEGESIVYTVVAVVPHIGS